MESLFTSRSENLDQYKRSLTRTVVCEFRFPTLLEIGDAKPPVEFSKALRKTYPNLERGNELNIGLGTGAGASSTYVHSFRSLKGGWSVTLKPNSIALEGTSYKGFSDLLERIKELLPAAERVIDSTFFTRVGLRYINVLDKTNDPIGDGWVNSDLVAPVQSGSFFGIGEYSGRIACTTSERDKGFLLQHGLRLVEGDRNSVELVPEYVLDIDVYQQEVEVADSMSVIDTLHSTAFNIFDWSLGSNARKHLRG